MVALNTVSVELQGGGYGDRLLAAVFAFEDENGKPVYFIYNFKRGTYYPFVPAPGDKARNTEQRAAAQGPARPRAALRRGHGALVPALGHPAVEVIRSTSGFAPVRVRREVRERYELARAAAITASAGSRSDGSNSSKR